MTEVEKQIDSKDSKRFVCNNCGATFVYIRIKTDEIVCRKCGSITKRESK